MKVIHENLRGNDGRLCKEDKLEDRNETAVYASVTAGRMRRLFRHTGITVIFSFLVPVVMLCGGMTSGIIRHDCDVVVMPKDGGKPLTQSLLDELYEIHGVENFDVKEHVLSDGRTVLSTVKVYLTDDEFHETVLEITRIPSISEYEVRYNCISEISTNMKYRMNREYFYFAAVVSFIFGLVTVGLSMNECLLCRREEMRILKRLGMERRERIEVKFRGNMVLYMPSVVITEILGLIVYLGMSISGGERLKYSQIILAVLVCCVLSVLTAVLSAATSVQSEKTDR